MRIVTKAIAISRPMNNVNALYFRHNCDRSSTENRTTEERISNQRIPRLKIDQSMTPRFARRVTGEWQPAGFPNRLYSKSFLRFGPAIVCIRDGTRMEAASTASIRSRNSCSALVGSGTSVGRQGRGSTAAAECLLAQHLRRRRRAVPSEPRGRVS